MSPAAVSLRTVEALLRELEAADKFSGVVGVKHGDQELLMDAFGYASRTWNIPPAIETRFDTASITKLFTAVATLQLIEQGAFSPTQDITFAVLAVGENAAWSPIKAIDEAVRN